MDRVIQTQRLLQQASGEELLVIASMAAQMLLLPRGEEAIAAMPWGQARMLEGLWRPLADSFEARALIAAGEETP